MLVPATGGEAELKERGSRFLGFVFRLESEQDATDLVAGVERRFADASHVCFAWRLDDENTWRAADAGEPRGTAGPPILDAIRERDLFQVIVLVVRWFGGVKLGKGGLARAYRDTARLALDSTTVEEVPDLVTVGFRVPLEFAGRVAGIVRRHGGQVDEESWDDAFPLFRVSIPRASAAGLEAILRDATSGAVEFTHQ